MTEETKTTYERGDSRVELMPEEAGFEEEKPTNTMPKTTKEKIAYARRQFVIEPLVFMFMFATIGIFPLMQQYVYMRYGEGAVKDIEDYADESQCDIDGLNITGLKEKMDQVQRDASNFQKNILVISSIPQLIILLFLGAYSDEAGRRFGLILPLVGFTLASIINVFVAFFDLDVRVFYLASILSGCTGSVGAVIMGAFAYLSDITTRENRTFRIVILESMITLGAALAGLCTGLMIHNIGYKWPFLVYCIMNSVNCIYTIFVVQEPLPRQSKFQLKCGVLIHYVKSTFRAYAKEGTNNRRFKVVSLLILFTLINFAGFAGILMKNLFLLNAPFCWGPLGIGYFSFANAIVTQIGAVLGIMAFQRIFKLPELWIAFIGFVSSATSFCFFAFAKESQGLLYASIPIGCFSMLPGPMIRALMSKVVGRDEQGEIFAGLGIVDLLMNVVASLVANAIYKATVATFAGAVFLNSACFIYGCAVMSGVLYFIFKAYENKYEPNDSDETTTEENEAGKKAGEDGNHQVNEKNGNIQMTEN